VQVPAARGSVIPDIDSINEDFPALWEPITAIVGKSISAPTLQYKKMRIRRSGGIIDRNYPVARMRSMISRILRRYALWVGSDRPIPWGSVAAPCEGGSPIDDMSGVVAKEPTDETEELLLLWCFRDI